MTGGEEGPLAHALANGGIKNGIVCVQQLCELFGRTNVYVELQRHLSREEEARNQAAVEISRKLNLSLLATNGVCHALPKKGKSSTFSPASEIIKLLPARGGFSP